MNRATYQHLKTALENKHFGMIVDLGCGEGFYGELLKEHCSYLIGVDHHLGRLSVARKFAGYDQVFYMDVCEFTPPSETEAVVMLEVIEHLPKADGEALLQKLSWVPLIIISTPKEFIKMTSRNGHHSLWTEQDLQNYGFTTSLFHYAFPCGHVLSPYQQCIFAVRTTTASVVL